MVNPDGRTQEAAWPKVSNSGETLEASGPIERDYFDNLKEFQQKLFSSAVADKFGTQEGKSMLGKSIVSAFGLCIVGMMLFPS